MKIRRSRRFTVKMAEYETYAFGGDVEMDHHDLGYADEDLVSMEPEEYGRLRDELTAAVLEELHEQLIGEIHSTAHITAHQKSFLLKVLRSQRQPPQPQPQAQPAIPTKTTTKRRANA